MLTEPQKQILHNLRTGKSKAITGKVIANRIGLKDDRVIRIKIRELIAQGYPIASSVHPPYGYYLVETEEEAREYINVIHSRLCEDAYRKRDFRKAVKALLNPKQAVMF